MPPLSIGFNVPFNEAIQATVSRQVVLPEIYYGTLQGIHRQLAFSVAGLASVDQLQAVLDSLTTVLKNGGTFAQWQKTITVSELGLPKHRLDNIFRTNIQAAYNHGHWQQQTANKFTRPYLMYDAINDSRTRPSHRAMDGIIRHVDDPFWSTHYPPNGYRCRCRAISLSETQASERSKDGNGLSKAINGTTMKPDSGWDYNIGESLTVGIERAVADRLASNTLNPVLAQAFIKTNSIVDEQQHALSLGVKAVDYGGRIDIAKDVNAVLTAFKQRGFSLPDQVLVNEERFINWAALDGTNSKDAVAVFVSNISQTQSYLLLNPLYDYWGRLALDVEKNSGYWSTKNQYHALHHEMGHYLHYTQDKNNYRVLLGDKLSPTELLIAEKVSDYAKTDKIEFVAEVFALLLNGGTISNDAMTLYEQLKGYKP